MLRIVFPLVIGLGGAAFLASLGLWQVQRLAWKEGILAEISAKIADAPVALPDQPDEISDKYLPVTVAGSTGGQELHVLVSQKIYGAGFRIISALDTEDGRRILIDRGFVRAIAKDEVRPPQQASFTGNLHWPDDRDRFTPTNDPAGNYWFARDIPEMAAALDTEPVLLIVASSTPAANAIQRLPVSTDGIPNSHLGYAVQWFGLATVWLGMTGFFLWRRTRAQR